MRWVCILFPQLALDAVLRQRPDPDEPLVLLNGPAQRRVLQAVNPAARKLGLRAGQSMTAAQAMSKGFATADYEAAEVEHWQQFLAAWAYRFSSQVSVHYPRTVVFEIESSLGLFGSWAQFEARLRRELTDLGFRHRIVAAPNPVAARVLANAYDGLVVPDGEALQHHLGQLPVDRVGLEPAVATALSRMGLRNLSQVQSLPRQALARRFEAQMLKHLDTLFGARPLALAFYLPPDRFDVRIELNFDVQSHQALLFPLRRLTGDLSAFLCGRDSGVQRFDLHLEHAGLPDSIIKVGLLSAERDPAMLFELARGRLEQVQVEAPVRGFRLRAEDLPSFVPQFQQLFDDRPQQTLPWEQLRERLRARLGDDAVQGLRFQADHRPECAWQHGVDKQRCAGLPNVHRPGWLLGEPQSVAEGSARILMGPERIESGWWDGDDVRRDYYLIQNRAGQQGWAYRAVGEGRSAVAAGLVCMNDGYAELHCLSNFSFQRGASSALELFQRAKKHGYQALAITDECTLAGIVRAWQAAKSVELPLVIGSEVRIENGPKLVLLVENLAGYQALCGLITRARRRTQKGQYQVLREDFAEPLPGLLVLWVPDSLDDVEEGRWLQQTFGERLWLAVQLHRGQDDQQRLAAMLGLAAELQIPAVASGDVHMHARGRRALQDTMTAIRHHVPVAEAGLRLHPNGERHLRSVEVLRELYPQALLDESMSLARRCTFDLGELRYQYPKELVPEGHSASSWLRHLTEEGIAWRWPQGPQGKVLKQIDDELKLIAELGYESYFLTVHDVVHFAREQKILCQGRGSAANSAVCFALGITEIDPDRTTLLFERFMSKERNEPPDIDVDFEHERREEVLQYVFRRYGRGRAALTAVVSTYHAAGAVRDVAKALGLPPDQINALADCCGHWSDETPPVARLLEGGFDPDSPVLRRVLSLTGQLIGFPRHLSQHPGGFVISEQPLDTLVPVENAAMAERTIIQWDKDDLDAVGLLKVDILALGMLSAIRRCFDLLRHHRNLDLSLATIPAEDKPTYDMISRADTIGVFQIESRAQMSMLPRLRPAKFYDLVIEVAIVRPGPIQGGMVHPYLRRRNKEEEETYPSPELKVVLERTLGVPLFQEQVMQIAIVAADYSPGEADQLRRSMAAWKRHGGLEPHKERLAAGMKKNGYTPEFAAQIFEQIKGFGSYGFPESHAASFALLTYASCWLKCHEPAAFACALINSWPMGFYSPDQILQDARRHQLQIRPVDVRASDWDCSLETTTTVQPAIRMGLRMIKGFREDDARRIEAARARGAFADVADLGERAALDSRAQALLADSGALRGLAGHRHRARWEVAGVQKQLGLFAGLPSQEEPEVVLPKPSVGEDLHADYSTVGTTLGPHPLALLRGELKARRCRSSQELLEVEHGRPVSIAGLVTGRQRPGTASGVTFVTLEDEFGNVNVVVWRDLAERQRQVLVGSQLLKVDGRWEREGEVRHLIAGRLSDLSPLLNGIRVQSRDFH